MTIPPLVAPSSGRKMLVTGSAGLIGSEVVDHFCAAGWRVHGIDNDMRSRFFGIEASTEWRARELVRSHIGYTHRAVDIRDPSLMDGIIETLRPDAVVHCAAQPSHDLAAERARENWDINVTATFALLESCRRWCPEAPFVFMSSNKVYGDYLNEAVVEQETRYHLSSRGFDETLRTDLTCRSIYGASKLAADIAVQEYGSYFGMPTVCLRGACLTGPNHSGTMLHGFLSYMVRCALTGSTYTINNYKGKQVRDNIHSRDVTAFIDRFIAEPRPGEVYNIGGGPGTDVSILEAIPLVEGVTGRPLVHRFEDHPRRGDFIFWVTDTGKAQRDYPGWRPGISLPQMLEEIVSGMRLRLAVGSLT